jgi:hypothetical protein
MSDRPQPQPQPQPQQSLKPEEKKDPKKQTSIDEYFEFFFVSSFVTLLFFVVCH